jgi:tetratricopeptide (TPR) repeat protein
MAKNLTKQEVEQDPFIRSYSSIQAFYFNNKNIIIASAIVIILAIGLAIGYHYYESSRNKTAMKKMGMAEEYFLRGNYKKALTGSKENFTLGFKQILDNYSGTKAGNLAHYYASLCEYHLGDMQQALAYIKNYKVPDGILGVAPLSFKGILLAQTGDYQQAAKTYIQAAKWDENKATTPYNYLKAAEAYRSAGELKEADKYARLVVDNYSSSSQVDDAKKLLGELSTTEK